MQSAQKVALVTGGGRGIGRAICLGFARRDTVVVVADLDRDLAASTALEVSSAGGEAVSAALDVGDPASISRCFEMVEATYGRLDVLVNNAAMFSDTPIDQIGLEEFDRMMAVNLRSVFLACQSAIKLMIPQGRGRIINMGSIAGKTGGSFSAAHYSAAKAGVACLTKSFAAHLGPFGITVNSVCPGLIDTAMTRHWPEPLVARILEGTPLRRKGLVEDVAEAVIFLASDGASFITGEALDVNGGTVMD